MPNMFLSEKTLFIPALAVSASLHVALIASGGIWPTAPEASVHRGANSLEVTVLSRPVVTVMEEEIVAESILNGNLNDEVVFSDRARDPAEEKTVTRAEPSKPERGALTRAVPLARVNPAPPYPQIARRRGWEGTVRLEVLVDKHGAPELVAVAQSSGHAVLDRAAADTVEQWRFSPARSGKVRFASRISIPVRFDLIKE